MSSPPTRARFPWRKHEQEVARRLGAIGPEAGDCVLYALAALFAYITVLTSTEALYRQWAELAIGPFIGGALVALGLALLARRRTRRRIESVRRAWTPRIILALAVFAGATAVPLALEILWRADNDAGSHEQPEVTVIEHAGQQLARGKNPYHAVTNKKGKIIYHEPDTSVVNSFDPYLPIMNAFGIPSDRKHDVGLTDARIFFSIATLGVTALALFLSEADNRHKMRAVQVIAILPTAALPLATGGDDMPVVAFLLLAMVLAQRRQPFWSGVVLGIVSAMKFTAWPLAALALFAARNKRGARRPDLMLVGMLLIALPVVVPYIISGPWAFFDNVVLFPLGLSGVTSPAASPLPGHLIVSAFPWLKRALPVSVGFAGSGALALYLWRRPPQTTAKVCYVGGVVMAVATLLAPATRIGYLLYPINFFVWAYLFKEIDAHTELPSEPGDLSHAPPFARISRWLTGPVERPAETPALG